MRFSTIIPVVALLAPALVQGAYTFSCDSDNWTAICSGCSCNGAQITCDTNLKTTQCSTGGHCQCSEEQQRGRNRNIKPIGSYQQTSGQTTQASKRSEEESHEPSRRDTAEVAAQYLVARQELMDHLDRVRARDANDANNANDE